MMSVHPERASTQEISRTLEWVKRSSAGKCREEQNKEGFEIHFCCLKKIVVLLIDGV